MKEIKAQLDRIEAKLDRLLRGEPVDRYSFSMPKCTTCGGAGYQGGDRCSGIIFTGIHDNEVTQREV